MSEEEEDAFAPDLFISAEEEEPGFSSLSVASWRIRICCVSEENQHIAAQETRVLWPSSRLLATVLEATVRRDELLIQDMDVVELGCGHGLVGICASLAGAARVFLTDYDERGLAVAARNAHENGVSGNVSVASLSWGAGESGDPRHLLHLEQHGQERNALLMLATDVVYNHESIEAMFASIRSGCAQDGAVCVLANGCWRLDKNVVLFADQLRRSGLKHSEVKVRNSEGAEFYLIVMAGTSALSCRRFRRWVAVVEHYISCSDLVEETTSELHSALRHSSLASGEAK